MTMQRHGLERYTQRGSVRFEFGEQSLLNKSYRYFVTIYKKNIYLTKAAVSHL